jgi:integrase/recombinase XerD
VRYFSKEELRALLEAAKAKRERDWLMILVTFNHGLRVSELLAITADSIRDGYLRIPRLKGSLETVQPLIEHPDPLLSERQPLIEYAEKSILPGEPLFQLCRQRVWQIIREHGNQAGIPAHKLFPHALKHSIAKQIIAEVGIENTRQWLGHRSMNSTGEYLRVDDETASGPVIESLKKLN